MKRILTVLLLVFAALPAEAQQAPFHKHYFVNPYIVNPARVGEGDRINVNLMHRSQWTSIPGAPTTSTMTFDSPIVDKVNGYGISFFTDQTDIFRRTGGSMNYGHHFNFDSSDVTISIGAGLNIYDNRIDFSKVTILQGTDPYAFQSVQNKAVFNGSGGFNLRIQRFNLGASLNHFGLNRLQYIGDNNEAFYQQEMSAIGMISYRFLIANKFGITPVGLFRYFEQSPYQYDGNLVFDYDNKFWVAGTYNSDYGVSISAGLNLYNSITVGYSYDLIMNGLRGNSGLSSEFIVGIKLGRTKNEKEAEFIDTDMDGVADEFDLEPDTEPGAFVNFQGITIKDKIGIDEFDTLIVKEVVYMDSNLAEGPTVVAGPMIPQNYSTSFFFDFDKATVKPNEAKNMADLAREIKANPTSKIVITGHADKKGSEEYNMILGQKRAQSIATILVNDYQVDPKQIVSVISKGKSDPLSKTRSYINRRVDVELVDPNMNVPTIQTPNGPGMTEMDVEEASTVPTTNGGGQKLEEAGVKDLLNDSDDGLFFTVQLGVFKNDVQSNYWKNVQPLYQMELENGTTRYYSGQFASQQEAQVALQKMKGMGFNDAFPTAYYKGQRISLAKANELLNGIGKDILKDSLR